MSLFGLFGSPGVPKLEARRDVAGLVRALACENDPQVRLLAARALGNVGDARAVAPLIAALTDRGFNALEDKDDRLLQQDDYIKRKDQDNAVCWAAAAALDNIERDWSKSEAARTAVPTFIAVLENRVRMTTKDRDYGVRRVAVETLGKIGDARALEALIAALKDVEDDVRYCAVEALGRIGDTRAVEPLLGTLMHGDYIVCKAAFRVLSEIDSNWSKSEAAGAAVPIFLAGLNDSDDCVRWAAAEALDRIGIPRPVTEVQVPGLES